ncbi:uncharacterized protein N0V89_001498 [Didymosphaeria variabile]|uniref:Protein NO VEIN C-terminal domain-containing protein n=1 Tax=Didymosphaeria variabile TaxID=1932322 RepID=A0A9W8XZH2_9PLEO|nr:uncharacterized protein N0V89_001498 [Didymosphaeria variabile]KAJ4360929.1 hypothetical protein N0V89_001498 [Didymosphaeria variabile]
MTDDAASLIMSYRDAVDNLGDQEPLTMFEAQAVLESIRVEKGYLDEETLGDVQAMRNRSRQTITRFVDKAREMEAAYTKSISGKLYSSKYHFVYELIQNADDSDFSIAKLCNNAPYIHFSVTPTTLTVDTNEDGFTRANVEAICATGKSSKKSTALDNHIGEKGFGFKSVFSVAHEVFVQSGLWAFRFKHKREDDGLGMVTPLDASPEALPPGVVTRIKLILSDSSASGHQRMLDAIDQIPKTTILHLHNLRVITITTADSESPTTTSIKKETLVANGRGGIVSIQNWTTTDGEMEKTHEDMFYTFTRHLTSLPPDNERLHRTNATVELAFPIHAVTKKPEISASGQHVFAYLPLHQMPIQFLPTEPMRVPFWDHLYPAIKSRLQNLPILETWQSGVLKKPAELRRLPDFFFHEGDPIFSDLSDEIYPAKEYKQASIGLLASLGVPLMQWSEALSRVEADIVSPVSRLKTRTADNAWQQACAQLLLQGLKINSIQQRVKKLAIIPVNKGKSWTGAPGTGPGRLSKIYLPTTEGIDIPTSIGLHLVDITTALLPHRGELFRQLGVQDCPKDEVLSNIEAQHKAHAKIFCVDDLLMEFRYLFHFHTHPALLKSWLRIAVGRTKAVKAMSSRPIYFLSANEYDTQSLLAGSFTEGGHQNEVANFVYEKLQKLERPYAYSQVHGHFWNDWLQLVTGALYHPPLLQPGNTSEHKISKTMLAVLEHCPHKFVGFLKAHWNEYKTEIHLVVEQLKLLEVPCTSGESIELRECYLPTTEIMSELQAFQPLGAGYNIPIVQLPEEWNQETRLQWEFLCEFGVRSKVDLDFYTTIHNYVDWEEGSQHPKEALIKLYTGVAGLATASDFDNLREELDCVYYFSEDELCIRDLACYVWEGPRFLTVKVPLSQHYGHVPHLGAFFKMALDISDYTLDDIIEELESMSTSGDPVIKLRFEEIYQWLDDNVRSDADWDRVRNAFMENSYVWGPDEVTYALGNCLWLSPFPLAGYVELSQVYPELEDFFVKRLHVERANPSMLVDEIKKMSTKRSPQVEIIRQRLIDVGRLIVKSGIDDTLSKSLASLAKVKFLPKAVDNGSKTLVGKDDDFAINDHQRFGDAFKIQNVLLEFSVEEVHILSTMFGYMGLSDKYLSQRVSEESAVGEGAIEHQSLSRAFKSKAYALYCCAARYKSTKALRGDVVLFNHLSNARIYITDCISTDLVLELKNGPIKVRSDRLAVHHEFCSGQLNFYVPKDERQRKSCYRSQLPKLLASIMGVDLNATQAILQILSCNLLELDDILSEQDITTVDWIPKPTFRAPASPVFGPSSPNEPLTSPVSHNLEAFERATPTPSSSTTAVSRASTAGLGDLYEQIPRTPDTSTSRPPLYETFVEEVVQSAFRARNRERRPSPHPGAHRDASDNDLPAREYDHEETFGSRHTDERAHDSRIGASGEAYVFEILRSLDLPGFSEGNWRSNMRRELLAQPRYVNLGSWNGRETADFVYTDRDGSLTQYLREHCVGSMPNGIARDHDFSQHPIEYFLEVKSTTSGCNTRFYMSSSQFEREGAVEEDPSDFSDFSVPSWMHNAE